VSRADNKYNGGGSGKYDRVKALYLMVTNDYKLVKIGITCDLRKRFKQIQAMSPVRLFCRYIKCDDPKGLECHLHEVLKRDRQHGEWFNFTNDISIFYNNLPRYPNTFLAPDRVGGDGWSTEEISIIMGKINKELTNDPQCIKDMRSKLSELDHQLSRVHFKQWAMDVERIYLTQRNNK
jgi:hypothetical protein